VDSKKKKGRRLRGPQIRIRKKTLLAGEEHETGPKKGGYVMQGQHEGDIDEQKRTIFDGGATDRGISTTRPDTPW